MGGFVKQFPRMDINKCPVCGAEESKELGTKYGTKIREPFSVRQCIRCDCVYVSNPVNPSFLSDVYSFAYFSGNGMDSSVNYVENLERQHYFFEKYDWQMGIELAQYNLKTRVKGLDVGCAVGNGLDWAKDRYDAEVYGVEISGYAADITRSRGYIVLGKTIGDVPAKYNGYFDIITAYEVMEHLYDPVDFVRNLSRLLKSGGVFHYSTGAPPSDEKILEWNYLRPEVHIIFYSPKCMSYLLKQNGLLPKQRRRLGEAHLRKRLKYYQPPKVSLKGRLFRNILFPLVIVRRGLQPDGVKP